MASNRPELSGLPTELHFEIMSYLVHNQIMENRKGFGLHWSEEVDDEKEEEDDEDDGDGDEDEETWEGEDFEVWDGGTDEREDNGHEEEALRFEISSRSPDGSRSHYLEYAQDLANLALTCKRLALPAQELLYEHVALPRSLESRTHRASRSFRVELFLRTIIDRPDLALRVQNLATWLRKDMQIASRVSTSCSWLHCVQIVLPTIQRLATPGREHIDWLLEMQNPTEFTVGSLILALLPNLKLLSLHVNSSSRYRDAFRGDPFMVDFYAPASQADVQRLAKGLNTTSITSLTLSKSFCTLLHLPMPSMKTLTLSYDGFASVAMPDGCLTKVETLVIELPQKLLHTASWSIDLERYHRSITKLFSSLSKVRTVELPSPDAAGWAIGSEQVKTIIVRDLVLCDLPGVYKAMAQLAESNTMTCVEMSWREGVDMDRDWPGFHRMSARAEVKAATMDKGKMWRFFK